jgi:hypothetical protein
MSAFYVLSLRKSTMQIYKISDTLYKKTQNVQKLEMFCLCCSQFATGAAPTPAKAAGRAVMAVPNPVRAQFRDGKNTSLGR